MKPNAFLVFLGDKEPTQVLVVDPEQVCEVETEPSRSFPSGNDLPALVQKDDRLTSGQVGPKKDEGMNGGKPW